MTDRRGETIELAAVRKNGFTFSVPRPHRHDAAILLTCEKLGLECVHPGDEQGFVTSTGRFVDRKEAARIAFAAGQIDRQLPRLTSEDVW